MLNTKYLIPNIKKVLGVLLAFALLVPLSNYFLKPNQAEAAWYNDNWLYREAVPIATHTASETNVYITFQLDTATLITNGKLQSSCQDIRVTDINGNLLAYHVGRTNACNNAATTIDALVPTMPAGAQTYYVYYGNPSAASKDAGAFSQAQCGNSCSTNPTLATEEKGPGPTAYWKFDEGYGTTTTDSTSNKIAGTLAGTTVPTWQTADLCMFNKCLFFDGSTSKITVATVINTVQTVSMWVRPNSVSSSALIDLDGGTHKITVSSGTISATGFTSPTIYVNGLVTSTLLANAWQHVTVTTGTSFNTTSSLTIGNSSSTFFKGFIDDVKIYNFARSASQVLAGYNSQANDKGTSTNLGLNQNNAFNALSNGLVGYWKMDETASPSLDSSGNGNSGTWNGDVAAASGKFGKSTTFDGVGDYDLVGVGTNLYQTPKNQWSMAAWVYPNSGGDTTKTIIERAQSSGYSFRVTSGTLESVWRWTTSPGITTVSIGTVPNNTWTHVAAVFDGTNINHYVNGAFVGSSNDPRTIAFPDNTPTDIGTQATDICCNRWKGNLDEIRLYNRALSADDVANLYNFAPGPVGYWNFEEGTGTTANDISGNANTGTITAGTGVYTNGKFGKAYNFDAANTVVNAGSGATLDDLPASGMTLDAWIYPKTMGEGSAGVIMAKNVGTTPSSGWLFQFSGTNALTFTVDGSTDLVRTTSNSVVTLNAWNHVAVYWDGVITTASSVHIFVNGTEATYATTTNGASRVSDASSTFFIGNDSTSATTFDGNIDEARVYNYARTQQQIIEDMNAGHPAGGSPVGTQVGYWKFDLGYGTTANDSSISNNSGTLTSMATAPSTATSGWTNSGKFGKALAFDGTNDYVALTSDVTALKLTGALTLSAWINLTDTTGTYDIITKWTGTAASSAFDLFTDSSGKLNMKISDGTTITTTTGNKTLSAATWYHVVGVYNPSTSVTLYINGIQDKQNTTSIPASLGVTTTIVDIGSENVGTTNYFKGTLDEVKVYGGVLTSAQILVDYNQGQSEVLGTLSDNSSYQKQAANQEYCVPGDATSCAAPIGEWHFNENSTQTVNDTSGNGFSGSLGTDGTTESTDPTWTPGYQGGGLSFNPSSSQRVTIAHNATLNPSAITIEAWLNIGSISQTGNFISKNDNSGYRCRLQNDGVGFYDRGATNNIGTGTVLSLNKWGHVACVGSSSGLKIYANGTLRASNSTAYGAGASAGSLLFGGTSGLGEYYNGKMDEMKIYSYERTPAQIAWDYNKGAPVGWWKFDECQGTTVNDSSGNSNSGTITIGASGTQTAVGTCTTSGTAWFNGVSGKINYSLNFDGTDDNVQTAAISPLVATTLTTTTASWGGWFNPSSSVTSKTLMEKYKEFQLTTNSSSQPICGIYYSAAFHNSAAPTQTLSLSTWNHVVCTYDGTNINTYLNGLLVKQSSETNNITADGTTKLYFGQTSGGANFYSGQIDDLRIYEYALTGTQAKTLYNNGAVNFAPSTGAP